MKTRFVKFGLKTELHNLQETKRRSMHKQARCGVENAGDTTANNTTEINMKQIFYTFDLES